MNLSPTFHVGKVRDAHGLKGELFVIFFSKEAPWLSELKTCSLVTEVIHPEGEKERKVQIFNVKRAKPHKIGAIIKLEGIEDRNQAEDFRGALFSIPIQHVTSREGDHLFLREVMDFSIYHAEEPNVCLGQVVAFSSNGAQDLLVVENTNSLKENVSAESKDGVLKPTAPKENKRFEIPFVPEFVEKTLLKDKRLVMSFPKDLLSL
jgi:16S rRNA processing protein RimM